MINYLKTQRMHIHMIYINHRLKSSYRIEIRHKLQTGDMKK